MTEDEPFIRTILATPDDQTARLVYADWLDDRADPRAEYLRLSVRVAELRPGSDARRDARERMLDLQHGFASWWLAAVGFRAVAQEPDPVRVTEAARLLGQPVERAVNEYVMRIEAAAVSGLTGVVALLKSWSKWNDDGTVNGVTHHLRLSNLHGRQASCEPRIYHPDFDGDPQFLEWYGDVVLMIYRGRHRLCACRLGFDGPPTTSELAYGYSPWVINGRELGFRRDHGGDIRRMSVPDLAELPTLSLVQAVARGLLPSH